MLKFYTVALLKPFITAILIATSFISIAQATSPDVLTLKKEQLPPSAKKIGSVKMLDGWRFNCGYTKTLEAVSEKAKELGGNAIVVTSVKSPDLWSTCYRIWADVYAVSNVEKYTSLNNTQLDSIASTILPGTAPYALLYVYRPKAFTGGIVQYNLHVDDEKVTRVTNNSMEVIKLTKPGKTALWARTEARSEETLDVQMGKIYFLRCSVTMGVMVGQPRLELVDMEAGLVDISIKDLQDMASELEQNNKG